MVLYGIKVNGTFLFIIKLFFFDLMNKGEANANRYSYQYTCSFAKMIQYWRQTWNQRTNGIADIQFPFGFVQVSFTRTHLI